METNFTNEEINLKKEIIIDSIQEIVKNLSEESETLLYNQEENNPRFSDCVVTLLHFVKQLHLCCKLLEMK